MQREAFSLWQNLIKEFCLEALLRATKKRHVFWSVANKNISNWYPILKYRLQTSICNFSIALSRLLVVIRFVENLQVIRFVENVNVAS